MIGKLGGEMLLGDQTHDAENLFSQIQLVFFTLLLLLSLSFLLLLQMNIQTFSCIIHICENARKRHLLRLDLD